MISIPFFPIYLSTNNPEILKKLTKVVCHLLFAPISLCTCLVFIVISIVLAPLSYISTTFRLLGLLFQASSVRTVMDYFLLLVSNVLFTPIFLLISIPANAVVFMINIYAEPKVNNFDFEEFRLQEDSILIFEKCINELHDSVKDKYEKAVGKGNE